MESFKITAKEFLLLCTATDADEVYGVDDAYENLTEDNVEKEVRNAQKSLEEKITYSLILTAIPKSEMI